VRAFPPTKVGTELLAARKPWRPRARGRRQIAVQAFTILMDDVKITLTIPACAPVNDVQVDGFCVARGLRLTGAHTLEWDQFID
jgi:hypothetical protein